MQHKFRGLALHTWTVDTTPFEAALAAAKSGGFDAVELRRVDFLRCREKGLNDAQVRELIQKNGLPVSAVGVEYGWIFSQPGAEQDRLFASFKEACENAVALGCPMVMSALGPGAGSLDEAAANIRRGGELAAQYKLRLCVEFQFAHPIVSSLDILRDLLKRAGQKNVGLLLDAYHLERGGYSGRGFEDVPAEEIFYVQFSDVPNSPPNGPPPTDRLPVGKGKVRWTELLQLLAAKNYQGYLSFEAPNDAAWKRSAADVAREGNDAARRALATAFK